MEALPTMVKKLVPVVALLVILGGAYKFVLAKPAATAKPKPHVEGIVYLLKKEFLVNLAEGRFAKLQVGLVLAEDDKAHVAAGGEHAATPPEGYGDMAQEGIVRSIITSDLTDKPADDLQSEKGREELQKQIVKDIKKKTDVKIEEIFFSDLTIQ
jgi:flagellar basal body-associated protein FliL